MNFMREKKIINNKSYFDRKRNVKVKLVYWYKDKYWRFVMTIVISDCLYSQKLGAFLENSGLYKTRWP